MKLSFESETRALSHLPTSLRVRREFPDCVRQRDTVTNLNGAAGAVTGNEMRDLAVRVSDKDGGSTCVRAAGYVGIEYQDHSLSPVDPNNPVSGTEVGFKVFGDVTLGGGEPVFLNVLGGYSTAFDSYWGRARLGIDLGRVTVGPEAILAGNESYDAQRVGAFISFKIPQTPLELTFSGGAHLSEGDGIFGDDDGEYGSLNVGWVF